MLRMFYPDKLEKSVYGISFEELYGKGYRGIIFDIDNTLVCHGAPADEAAILLFKSLREFGFQTVLLSNNKEPRVKSFADEVGSLYIYRANKPGKAGYLKAISMMNGTVENTLFVGDQLFTDVWGAKRVGIHNILVEPIHPKEEIQIVIKRLFEKIVLFFYHRRKDK